MLSPIRTEDGRRFQGRWLRLRWSQSLAGQPARLVVRFVRSGGDADEHALAAAALGRGRWTWRAPSDLERIEIASPAGREAEFRIDALAPLPLAALALAVLRRHPRDLPAVLWPWASDRARSVPAHDALDLAAPGGFARLAAARRRPFEPDGLDADLREAATRGPLLGFAIPLREARELPALRRTLAAFAAQHDFGFAVRVTAPDALVGEIGAAGLGERVEMTSREDGAGAPWPGGDAAFVAALLPGDEPAPEAVLLLRAHLAERPGLDLLYTDDAVRTAAGLLARPKPDWSPLLQEGVDYVGRACLVRAALAPADVPWQHQPGRIAAERGTAAVGHLKRVLFTLAESQPHPRHPEEPTQPSAAPQHDADRGSGSRPTPRPRATLIVPTRDRAGLLRRLVDSLAGTQGDFDLVVVDNGSEEADALAMLDALEARPEVRVLRHPGEFNFSRLVNAGAAVARGDVLVLLNNDCEAVAPDWLGRLVSRALAPGIGAVGAKLLFADRTLQHAGVALGLGGEAGHRDRRMPEDHPGTLGRLQVAHEVAAVTGACLAVRRETFLAAGGFDEALPVAFNDIDFCLRLLGRGLRNVLEPGAVLLHAESASRGRDEGPRRARFLGEAAIFRERWRALILDDPWLHPMISTVRFHDRLG